MKLAIKKIFVSILIITCSITLIFCTSKKTKTVVSFDFSDIYKDDKFMKVLDVTEEYVYYFITSERSAVKNVYGDYFRLNDVIDIYRRDLKGNDTVVLENISEGKGFIDISSIVIIDDEIYYLTYINNNEDPIPYTYKIIKEGKQGKEVILEAKVDSVLAVPRLSIYKDNIYVLIEDVEQLQDSLMIKKKLYNVTQQKDVIVIDESEVEDLSKLRFINNYSYGPSIYNSENYLVFSTMITTSDDSAINSTIYIYDGEVVKEVLIEDAYILNTFEIDNKIFFLEELKGKQTFVAQLKYFNLNDESIDELDILGQAVYPLYKNKNSLLIEKLNSLSQSYFIELDLDKLNKEYIDNIFSDQGITYNSPSGFYKIIFTFEDNTPNIRLVEKLIGR